MGKRKHEDIQTNVKSATKKSTFFQNAKKQNKREICETVFKTQNLLKKHFSTVHDNEDKQFTCNICAKFFKLK